MVRLILFNIVSYYSINQNLEKMETLSKNTQTQGVKAPIAQNSAQAQKLIANFKANRNKAVNPPLSKTAKLFIPDELQPAAEDEAEPTTPKVKKEPKVRAESNEAAAERMLKEKATDAEITKYYTKYYKAHGQNDSKWIEKRASIYMSIALRRAEAKKAASAKK
jgi:hypothetical protein